jgi:FkbM family methyltransferase
MSTDRFSIIEEGKPLWPESYLSRPLDPNHCKNVLEGCYDVPYWPEKPPVILDIGANVGAFTRWAVKRWPGCTVHAYEPQPENFRLLEQTAAATDTVGAIHLHQQAVADKTGKRTLFNQCFNCGEYSFYLQGGTDREPQDKVEVDTIAGMDLPKADILKLDCEGAEGAILASLYAANRLMDFSAIMLEYHNAEDGVNIRHGLEFNGFTCTGEDAMAEHRGELQFLRNDLLPVTEYDEQNNA